jgi:hypothetical protein
MYGSPFYPQVTQPRSSIPRVVGILAVIFAVIGAASSALFTWGPLDDFKWHRDAPGVSFMVKFLYLWGGLSAVLFILHLVGGILAITYRAIGLRLLIAYAVGALVLVVLDLVVIWFAAPSGAHHRIEDSLQIPHTLYSAIAAVWPIIVLALVSSRRARAACT